MVVATMNIQQSNIPGPMTTDSNTSRKSLRQVGIKKQEWVLYGRKAINNSNKKIKIKRELRHEEQKAQ